jgi:hypothetical protein
MDHVRYLAESIGPRGSTTPNEAEAARYAAEILPYSPDANDNASGAGVVLSLT